MLLTVPSHTKYWWHSVDYVKHCKKAAGSCTIPAGGTLDLHCHWTNDGMGMCACATLRNCVHSSVASKSRTHAPSMPNPNKGSTIKAAWFHNVTSKVACTLRQEYCKKKIIVIPTEVVQTVSFFMGGVRASSPRGAKWKLKMRYVDTGTSMPKWFHN